MSIEENRIRRLNDAFNCIRNCVLYYHNIIDLAGGERNLVLRRNANLEISQPNQISIQGIIHPNNSKRNISYNFLEINHIDSIRFVPFFYDDINDGINRNNDKNFLCKKRLRKHGSFNSLKIENIENRFISGNQENSNLDIITTNNSEENNNRGIFTINNSEENSILIRNDNPGIIITSNREINVNRGFIGPNNLDKNPELNKQKSMNIIN